MFSLLSLASNPGHRNEIRGRRRWDLSQSGVIDGVFEASLLLYFNPDFPSAFGIWDEARLRKACDLIAIKTNYSVRSTRHFERNLYDGNVGFIGHDLSQPSGKNYQWNIMIPTLAKYIVF